MRWPQCHMHFQGLTLFIFFAAARLTPQKTLRKFLKEGWRAQGVAGEFYPVAGR